MEKRSDNPSPTDIRQIYLDTAEVVPDLLGASAVARSWDGPSALRAFTVSGLAGHLARQVTLVPEVLTGEVPGPLKDSPGDPADLVDFYARAPWARTDVDEGVNVLIRRTGEQEAQGGPAELVARTRRALDELRHVLPTEPVARQVFLPWLDGCLSLEDYLTTRLVEIVVHCDDMVTSLDIEAPPLPEAAVDTVLVLLTRVAARRHGAAELLRAFTRAERAPASVSVF